MPRFVYSILLLILISLSVLIYLITTKVPNEQHAVPAFLFTLFIFMSGVSSLVSFYIAKLRTKRKETTELKQLYRTAFKKSAFLSAYLIGLMILRINDLFSVLTALLFTITCFLGPYLLSRFFR
jgi:predicted MFS family arabinose efflux permease